MATHRSHWGEASTADNALAPKERKVLRRDFVPGITNLIQVDQPPPRRTWSSSVEHRA
jgi:hypothetical protein